MRTRCERGAIATWAAMTLPAFVLAVGMGVDLAGHAAAEQQARAAAADAARSAGQYLLISPGLRAKPDIQRARAAATAYLRGSGYGGSVTVAADGRITVSVEGRYATLFLSVIGVKDLAVRGEAAARSTSVINGLEP